jgi:hypothetical protein
MSRRHPAPFFFALKYSFYHHDEWFLDEEEDNGNHYSCLLLYLYVASIRVLAQERYNIRES